MLLRKVAKELGVSHAFLSQIRNGKRPLPEHLRARLEEIGAYHLLTTGKHQQDDVMSPRVEGAVVELEGLEPSASSMPLKRSPR